MERGASDTAGGREDEAEGGGAALLGEGVLLALLVAVVAGGCCGGGAATIVGPAVAAMGVPTRGAADMTAGGRGTKNGNKSGLPVAASTCICCCNVMASGWGGGCCGAGSAAAVVVPLNWGDGTFACSPDGAEVAAALRGGPIAPGPTTLG